MIPGKALCAAMNVSLTDAAPPEWLHLMPAGEVHTHDGRGPYRIPNAAVMIAASLAGGKLPLDENHATDLAAPKGGASPAHGWIVDLQQRADGVWGKVEWVDPSMMIWRRYRGVSPVIAHDSNGVVTALMRASLTNTPNLKGLTSLHHKETDMDIRKAVLNLLRLPYDADATAILAKVEEIKRRPKIEGLSAGSLRQQLLAKLGLSGTVTDDALVEKVREIKGLPRLDLTTRHSVQAEAQQLALQARSYQAEMARNGMKIGIHTAVREIQARNAAAPVVSLQSKVPPKPTTMLDMHHIGLQSRAYQAKLARDGITIDLPSAVRAVMDGTTI